MDNASKGVLDKFYEKLRKKTKEEKKGGIRKDSVLLTFLHTTSNKIHKILQAAEFTKAEISYKERQTLIKKALIMETDNVNHYVLSAKGVWEIERERDFISDSTLIEYFDMECFSGTFRHSSKTLSLKERCVIFSMIAARAFSEESVVDLSQSLSREHWQEVLEQSLEKMKELKLVESGVDEEDLFGAQIQGEPVRGIFRRINELSRKVKGIYKSPGNERYYLDISDGECIEKKELKYLFSRLLEDKKIDYTEIENLMSFFKTIARQKSSYLFDPKHHLYSNPRYDKVLRDVLVQIA